MSKPFVVTIILNTNRCEDTLACLKSLEQTTYKNHKVLVLDNYSTDGSIDAIGENFPHVQIVPLQDNFGYAGNNNVGIEMALKQGADWVFILNEDTIVDSDCISLLVANGESNMQIGMLGPMVYHYNEENVIQSAGGKMSKFWDGYHLGQNEIDQGQFVQPHNVDWISGCAIMVRQTLIENIGMIDEDFFYYWEETEWCLRVREAGWEIQHVPAAKIWHKGVQRNYSPKPIVTYYNTRNHLFMLSKHKAPIAAWLYNWSRIFRTFLSWTIKPKWRSKAAHRNAMFLGVRDFLQHRTGKFDSDQLG